MSTSSRTELKEKVSVYTVSAGPIMGLLRVSRSVRIANTTDSIVLFRDLTSGLLAFES